MIDRMLGKRACVGSHVHWGHGPLQNAVVLETPSKVQELMGTVEDGVLLELHNRLLPEVPVLIKVTEIIAINPYLVLADATD